MKINKLLYYLVFSLGLFILSFVFIGNSPVNEVKAQVCQNPGDPPAFCIGPSYCAGPCDTLWYNPCACSCSANYCTYVECDAGQWACQSTCGGTWRQDPIYLNWYCAGRQGDSERVCSSGNTLQTECPQHTNPCINICSPASGPTSTPPPAGPTLSPPPVPPVNPTCRVTGPTNVIADPYRIHDYLAECWDSDGDLSKITINRSPTASQTWDSPIMRICNAIGSSSNCTGSTTWDTPGTYYIVVNGYDLANHQCSGNPWCPWTPNPPSTVSCTGWVDCYDDPANVDVLTVTVTAEVNDITIPDLTGLNALNGIGDTKVVVPNTSGLAAGRSVASIAYSLVIPPSLANLVTFTPTSRLNPPGPLSTTVTANAIQTGGRYKATVVLDNGVILLREASIDVNPSAPWWQVIGGSIVAGRDIQTEFPLTCTGTCLPQLIIPSTPTSLDVGVAQYNGSLSYTNGSLSSRNWSASTLYKGEIADFNYFYAKMPDIQYQIPSPPNITLTRGELEGVGPDYHGYKVFRYEGSGGDLVISGGDINLGNRKVILYVRNANLIIQNNINLTPGSGFFMAIVDKKIKVAPSVTSLEGLYVTDEVFETGTGDLQLKVRGSVVGYGDSILGVTVDGIKMERNLIGLNSSQPAEIFQNAPDQLLKFPPFLGNRTTKWLEVDP